LSLSVVLLFFSSTPFSVEHILPRVKGGTDNLDNLAFACQGCNNFKYTITDALDPLTGKLTSLYHPRKHIWKEHFKWNENYTKLVGLSAIGRTTIQKLKLNREGVINQRRVLAKLGLHPPEV